MLAQKMSKRPCPWTILDDNVAWLKDDVSNHSFSKVLRAWPDRAYWVRLHNETAQKMESSAKRVMRMFWHGNIADYRLQVAVYRKNSLLVTRCSFPLHWRHSSERWNPDGSLFKNWESANQKRKIFPWKKEKWGSILWHHEFHADVSLDSSIRRNEVH